MALEQTHAARSGNEGKYWKVVQTNFNRHNKTGQVTLYCFKNKPSANGGKSPISDGIRKYDISGTEYTDFFGNDALLADGKSPIKRSYEMVKARREVVKAGFHRHAGKHYADADVTDGIPDEGAPEVDIDTAAESFFEGALDV